MLHQFTESAQQALALADQHARRLNHEYIGTEHILLGLMDEQTGQAARTLARLGTEPARLRAEIAALGPAGRFPVTMESIPYTPRAMKVIERAVGEARLLMQPLSGPEHLLCSLTTESKAVAALAMVRLGLDLRQVRREAIRIRLAQLTIVERAVRPLKAATPLKRKMREELLAHLSAIFDEEQAKTSDPHAALLAASNRFGSAEKLSRQLQSSVSRLQHAQYWTERQFGWRAPESGTHWSMRLAMQTFAALVIVCLLAAAVLVACWGWHKELFVGLRPLGALAVIFPPYQFVMGACYFKMRDALWGAFGQRQSHWNVIRFAGLVSGATIAAGFGVYAFSGLDASKMMGLWPSIIAAGVAAPVVLALHAWWDGPVQIRDTIWACLDLSPSES